LAKFNFAKYSNFNTSGFFSGLFSTNCCFNSTIKLTYSGNFKQTSDKKLTINYQNFVKFAEMQKFNFKKKSMKFNLEKTLKFDAQNLQRKIFVLKTSVLNKFLIKKIREF
jgi:hypothetical protein